MYAHFLSGAPARLASVQPQHLLLSLLPRIDPRVRTSEHNRSNSHKVRLYFSVKCDGRLPTLGSPLRPLPSPLLTLTLTLTLPN